MSAEVPQLPGTLQVASSSGNIKTPENAHDGQQSGISVAQAPVQPQVPQTPQAPQTPQTSQTGSQAPAQASPVTSQAAPTGSSSTQTTPYRQRSLSLSRSVNKRVSVVPRSWEGGLAGDKDKIEALHGGPPGARGSLPNISNPNTPNNSNGSSNNIVNAQQKLISKSKKRPASRWRCLLKNVTANQLAFPEKTKPPNAYFAFKFFNLKPFITEVVKKSSDPIFPKFSREWLWETVNPSKLPNRKFVIEYRHVKGTVGKTHVTIGEAQFDFLAIATGPISRQIELFSVTDPKQSVGWVNFELVMEEFSRPEMIMELKVEPIAGIPLCPQLFVQLTPVQEGTNRKIKGLPNTKSRTLKQLGSNVYILPPVVFAEASYKGLMNGELHVVLKPKHKKYQKDPLVGGMVYLPIKELLTIKKNEQVTFSTELTIEGKKVADLQGQVLWEGLPRLVQMVGGVYNSKTGIHGGWVVDGAVKPRVKGVEIPVHNPDEKAQDAAFDQAPKDTNQSLQQQDLSPPVNDTVAKTNSDDMLLASDSDEGPESISPAVEGNLPPGWEQAKDAQGNIFYRDTVNNRTQWTHPSVAQSEKVRANPAPLAFFGTLKFKTPPTDECGDQEDQVNTNDMESEDEDDDDEPDVEVRTGRKSSNGRSSPKRFRLTKTRSGKNVHSIGSSSDLNTSTESPPPEKETQLGNEALAQNNHTIARQLSISDKTLEKTKKPTDFNLHSPVDNPGKGVPPLSLSSDLNLKSHSADDITSKYKIRISGSTPNSIRGKQTPKVKLEIEVESNSRSEETLSAFIHRMGINNIPAVSRVLSAGFSTVTRFAQSQPQPDDLDLYGFTVFERNLILQNLPELDKHKHQNSGTSPSSSEVFPADAQFQTTTGTTVPSTVGDATVLPHVATVPSSNSVVESESAPLPGGEVKAPLFGDTPVEPETNGNSPPKSDDSASKITLPRKGTKRNSSKSSTGRRAAKSGMNPYSDERLEKYA